MFRFRCIITVVFFLISLSSCGNSLEDMLKEYNEGFSEANATLTEWDTATETLSPGDAGFNEKEMLRDEYFLYEDSTLILAAPPNNVVSYVWIVYDPEDNDKEISVETVNGKTDTKDFVIYVPYSGLEVGHTYKLTLKIKDGGGVDYTDTCGLVVYKHYIY